MEPYVHPRVVVGVDGSYSGLAAIRAAVAEARRRGLPLHAVRARTTGIACVDSAAIATAFLEALGAFPTDLRIDTEVSLLPVRDALCAAAADPGDLIVVGTSGKGAWHALWSGSVLCAISRRSRCPVLAVPAPQLSRAARRPRRWRARGWDPLRELERTRPQVHSRLR